MQQQSHGDENAQRAGTVHIGEFAVARMAFGTIHLPGPNSWGWPENPDERRRVLRRAVELGVNYLDTAAYYGPLVSDQLIVEALYPYPPGLVIGTKVGGWRGSDKRWFEEIHPKQLRATVEDNLQRLKVEALDLVHLRLMDRSSVPFEDSLGAMIQLRETGKIRNIGLSNVTLDQLKEARAQVPVASVQNIYNLADQRDQPTLDYCASEGIAYMPYFPLALGKLGKGVGPLTTIAERHGATPAQIALAWLLARSPVMVVIPGTKTVAHLEENIAVTNIALSQEEVDELANSPDVQKLRSMRV